MFVFHLFCFNRSEMGGFGQMLGVGDASLGWRWWRTSGLWMRISSCQGPGEARPSPAEQPVIVSKLKPYWVMRRQA